MRAWRVNQHGGPEALVLSSCARPDPGPMEVRIKIEAVGLNHLDVWVRKGVPGHSFPLPITPGCDIAGVIDPSDGAFGPGAERALNGIQSGHPVLLNPGLSCGHCAPCLSGADNLCRHFGLFGETQDGGLAEYVVAPVANILPRPVGLSAVDAATLPVPFVTAWAMLGEHKANVRPGEFVLIQAGGSAVSVAAIQIAKLRGASVIATVGSADKVQKVKTLGADHVILYREKNFLVELRKILGSLGRKGVEVVVDHVGADTFEDSLKALTWGGRYVTCGATSGGEAMLNLRALFFKNLSVLGSTMGSKGDLLRIVELVRQGKLRPVVDSQFPFDQARDAFARIESRLHFGKVIVTM